MSESEEIKGPERVWVRVCRHDPAGDVVDQQYGDGSWRRHATSLRHTIVEGTWREYVRADLVPEQAPVMPYLEMAEACDDSDLIDEDPPQAADLDLVPVVLDDRRRPIWKRTRTVLADHATAAAIRGAYIGGACLDGIDWPLVTACLRDVASAMMRAGGKLAAWESAKLQSAASKIDNATTEVPL